MAATQQHTHGGASSGEFITPSAGREDLTELLSFMEAQEARHATSVAPAYFLSGAEDGDRLELGTEVHQLLKRVLENLSQGRSVRIMAHDQEITTQQAADLLGLSRPTVVKLIDQGELEADVPGRARRKLKLSDVLDYRAELHARRSDFVGETSAAYNEVDDTEEAQLLLHARQKT